MMKSLLAYLQEKILDNLPWKSAIHLFMWAALGMGMFHIIRVILKIFIKLMQLFS